MDDTYGMYRPVRACLCKNVSYEDIEKQLKHGARNFEEVQKATKCSTGCGTCEWRIREFITKKLKEKQENP